MSISLINLLTSDLINQLGDRHFFTIQDLHNLGFFGTTQAARLALKTGKLPFIQVSPRRCLIPRIALLEYLKNNLSENLPSEPKNKICAPK